MDYSLFFNHLSLPASGAKEAYSLLFEAFQGVLRLNRNEDRFIIYYDGDSLDDCLLAESFSYNDFKNRLFEEREIDLLTFIYEIEDKSPFINHLSESYIEDLTSFTLYFKDRAYDDSVDIVSMAWLESGVLFSLATEKIWSDYTVSFLVLKDEERKPDKCWIYNISKKRHAKLILDAMEGDVQDICPDAIFTNDFIDWYKGCKKEDKNKIKKTLGHCCENNFQFGRPVIDTLYGSDYPNMKEIRVGNAHAQSGKIRIIFAMDPNRKANILSGFIKHGSDYTEYIRIADNLFKAILSEDQKEDGE